MSVNKKIKPYDDFLCKFSIFFAKTIIFFSIHFSIYDICKTFKKTKSGINLLEVYNLLRFIFEKNPFLNNVMTMNKTISVNEGINF